MQDNMHPSCIYGNKLLFIYISAEMNTEIFRYSNVFFGIRLFL